MSRLTRYRSDIEDYDYIELAGGISQACVNKLGQLEDIEDELGCPLEVVFKALKEGLIIEAYDNELNETFINTFEPNELVLDFVAKSIITGEKYIDYVFPLENYQKTWWLKSDRSE